MESFTSDFRDQTNLNNKLVKMKSIELGHIFSFGQKYSKPFNLQIDTKNGKIFPFMGSYGLGISRIPAAVIENSHDKDGIIWPNQLCPFKVNLINLLTKHEKTAQFADSLYDFLITKNIEFEDSLVLKRTISNKGVSKAYINNSPVSLNELNQIGQSLVEVQGQFDNHTLLNSLNHINFLDQFGNYQTQKNNTKLKHEAIKSGLINEKDYDAVVKPHKMINPD